MGSVSLGAGQCLFNGWNHMGHGLRYLLLDATTVSKAHSHKGSFRGYGLTLKVWRCQNFLGVDNLILSSPPDLKWLWCIWSVGWLVCYPPQGWPWGCKLFHLNLSDRLLCVPKAWLNWWNFKKTSLRSSRVGECVVRLVKIQPVHLPWCYTLRHGPQPVHLPWCYTVRHGPQPVHLPWCYTVRRGFLSGLFLSAWDNSVFLLFITYEIRISQPGSGA